MKKKKNQLQQFGLCLNNEGYAVSLEVGKVYRVIRDTKAANHGYIRVIDESGEDYAYIANRFHLIQLRSVYIVTQDPVIVRLLWFCTVLPNFL